MNEKIKNKFKQWETSCLITAQPNKIRETNDIKLKLSAVIANSTRITTFFIGHLFLMRDASSPV